MENISCSDSRTDHNAVLYFVFFVVSTLGFFYVDGWTGTSTRNVVRHDHHTYFLFYFVSCLSSLSLSSYSSSFERCLPGETITASPSCLLCTFRLPFFGLRTWRRKQTERTDGRNRQMGRYVVTHSSQVYSAFGKHSGITQPISIDARRATSSDDAIGAIDSVAAWVVARQQGDVHLLASSLIIIAVLYRHCTVYNNGIVRDILTYPG